MFSEEFKHKLELATTYAGVSAFVLHSLIILLIYLGLIPPNYFPENLFGHPFAALFSPFSILLIYEVYLLIYYLRKSYTKSVSKQIEIMSLILLRNSFKDIGKLMQGKTPLLQTELIKDLSGFVLLLLLLWTFNHLNAKRPIGPTNLSQRFIKLKFHLTSTLFWLLIGISIYSFSHWIYLITQFHQNHALMVDPSYIFYTEFFTVLTFIDVILLLSSAKNLKDGILVIRNSGYVLSTMLMRVSFSLEGWDRIIAVIMGAALAVFMLWISNRKNLSIQAD
jgi:hypothetical protein